MNRFTGILLSLFALTSCAIASQPSQQTRMAQEQVDRARAMIDRDWPAPSDVLATTDGQIYLDNLNSQIAAIEGNPRLAARTRFGVTLAGLYYQRFQIEGRLADVERSLAVLKELEGSADFLPRHRLIYAQVLMGVHAFDEAEAQIEAAAEAGASVSALRDALEQSQTLPRKTETPPDAEPGDYAAAAREAAAYVDRGQLEVATGILRRAQDNYRDSNPFPLAWIHVQQGIAFLRFGAYDEARRFFAVAHERFPQYFLATEHLAETEGLLGNHERSAALYRRVTAQNDHPAFWHGLAQAEEEIGNGLAAREAAERAARGYSRLLEKYPLMFADHAVGYYLDVGNDAEALRLARLNFRHRQDLSAHLTLAEALHRSGADSEARALLGSIRADGLAPPEITLPGEGRK